MGLLAIAMTGILYVITTALTICAVSLVTYLSVVTLIYVIIKDAPVEYDSRVFHWCDVFDHPDKHLSIAKNTIMVSINRSEE